MLADCVAQAAARHAVPKWGQEAHWMGAIVVRSSTVSACWSKLSFPAPVNRSISIVVFLTTNTRYASHRWFGSWAHYRFSTKTEHDPFWMCQCRRAAVLPSEFNLTDCNSPTELHLVLLSTGMMHGNNGHTDNGCNHSSEVQPSRGLKAWWFGAMCETAVRPCTSYREHQRAKSYRWLRGCWIVCKKVHGHVIALSLTGSQFTEVSWFVHFTTIAEHDDAHAARCNFVARVYFHTFHSKISTGVSFLFF